jgi:membrane protein
MKKKLTFKGVWGLIKEAGSGFMDDKVLKLSGSLAYLTVFSIGPLIIVIIFVADLVWGREAIEGTIYNQLKGLLGPDASIQIQDIIKNAAISNQGTLAAIVGIVTLLFSSTAVFAEIQDSINSIWNLKPKPKKGWLKMIMNRLLSFSIVVSLGFLLLVSLIINGLIEAMSLRLIQMFPDIAVAIVYIINLAITFAVISFLFAIIFKVLPDAKIRWKDVLTGAMVTAALFMLGKFAITFYISTSDITTTYGAAGSLVILLLWVYYSSLILYFGAEFTKAYAANYGGRIYPNHYAVWVKQVEVEQEGGSLQSADIKKENVKPDGSPADPDK